MFKTIRALGISVLLLAPAEAVAAGRLAQCNLPAADKVLALNAVENLMGRYSHLSQLGKDSDLEALFAMKTEGVSWKAPMGPTGIAAMKERFAHPLKLPREGALTMHALLTPVIEIAGDGKTAKGVWDSFGPDIMNGNDIPGSWVWGKYAVDFVKQDDGWKIWHLQFYPVFMTPYDKSITQSAKDRSESRQNFGAAPPALPGMGDWNTPGKATWIYDGKSAEQGPFIPVPYCRFDPATSYGP